MEKLRLQCHDHGNELSRLSRGLFGHEGLTDVTLTCRGGAPFHAHKILLAAASTYFRNFFLEVQGKITQHQVIFMKDIESSEMEYLLQFIYLGEVDIPSLELERLIAMSKELGIIGLDAVNKEENGGERRTLKATKRQLKSSHESPEPLTPKIAKVKNDPFNDEEVENQDFFDDYMDSGHGEEDNVTKNDVGDKPGNEVATPNEEQRWIRKKVRKAKMANRSAVWNHFKVDRLDETVVKCDYCDSKFKNANSTGNQLRHLRNVHDMDFGSISTEDQA